MNQNSVNVTILLFGALRELAGTEETINASFDSANSTSNVLDAGYAWNWLINQYPALKSYERSILVAVNESHVGMNHTLKGGDTVAFFPPVSGG